MDDYTIEIIVFVIILLIVAGKPYSVMEMAESILGKFILLVIIVALALKSTIAGLLGALLLIILSEGVREGMETKQDKKDKKDKKEDLITILSSDYHVQGTHHSFRSSNEVLSNMNQY